MCLRGIHVEVYIESFMLVVMLTVYRYPRYSATGLGRVGWDGPGISIKYQQKINDEYGYQSNAVLFGKSCLCLGGNLQK